MKKFIRIASAVVLVLGVTVVLVLSNISYCPGPITFREQRRIVEDYHRVKGKYYAYAWFSGGFIHNCRCYGRDNGYIIFCYSAPNESWEYDNVVIVDGVEFHSPESFSIYAYKDGEFIDIKDAYEQGLISRKALLEAQKYHNRVLEEEEK